MRDYGKVATRFWTDPRVLKLGRDAKLVFLYLLAGPETNCIGCFRITPMHIAASDVCSPEEAQGALKELAAIGLIDYDLDAKVALLPNFLKYNPICNESAGKAAMKALRLIPDTPLLIEIATQVSELIESADKWRDKMPEGWKDECRHMCQHTCQDRCGLIARAHARTPIFIPSTSTSTSREEEVNCRADRPTPRVAYREIIEHLNEKAGTRFRHETKATRRLLKARWNEGYRLENFQSVIDGQCDAWLTDAEMVKYLRPETLFGTKFEAYLNGRKDPVAKKWKPPGERISDEPGRI